LVLTNQVIRIILEPSKKNLMLLNQAESIFKDLSLRETAQWLHRKTGRSLSHVGLRKDSQEIAPTKTEESNSTESQKVSQTDC
jgi:hypothetical protein